MKSKMHVSQVIRHMIQIVAFIFFPGLFLSIFNALRDVCTALAAGTFSFSELAGQLVFLFVMFLITALWGRFFCGYLCAFGAVQELAGRAAKHLMPHLRAIPARADRILKYIKFAVLALIIVPVWIVQLPVDSTLSPWGVFGMLVSGNPAVMNAAIPTVGFAILIAILIGSFFAERFFCRYLCPLGAVFTLISGHRLFRIRRKEDACSGCGLCSRSCTMGISVHEQQTVRSGECIDCMRCKGECRSAALCGDPHPAAAGTAAALVMCGLVSVGEIAVSKRSDPETYTASVQTEVQTGSLLKSTVVSEEAPEQYADGVYTGSGNGFRGTTQVQVTVENGMITDITVLSYEDDQQFFSRAQSGVIADILEAQSVDVSTVSGATFSSNGILEAVADALDLDLTGPDAASDAASGMGHGLHRKSMNKVNRGSCDGDNSYAEKQAERLA